MKKLHLVDTDVKGWIKIKFIFEIFHICYTKQEESEVI